MQYWVDHDKIPIADLVREGDPDKLHMSDWATHCVTQALFGAIEQAVEKDGYVRLRRAGGSLKFVRVL